MAGMNLSQSMQENKQANRNKNLFDMGLIGSFVIFLIVLGMWGGLEWYTKGVNDEIAAKEAAIAEGNANLSGKNANKVADFADRIILISQDSDVVNSRGLFAELESLMVPEIVLTKYDYNKEEQYILFAGDTDNFKYLAQQILALKKQPTFSDIKVDSIARSTTGRIVFGLKTTLATTVK